MPRAVVRNAQVLAETLMKGGIDIVTGGTDTHLMLVDLRPKGVTGKDAEAALGRAHITCNKNGIPFDPQPPTVTSGVRLGTPAGTTRGFGEAEFREIGEMIVEVVDGLAANGAGRQRRGRGRGQGAGPGALRPLPGLCRASDTRRPGAAVCRRRSRHELRSARQNAASVQIFASAASAKRHDPPQRAVSDAEDDDPAGASRPRCWRASHRPTRP